jgi:dienelactone hydrolase
MTIAWLHFAGSDAYRWAGRGTHSARLSSKTVRRACMVAALFLALGIGQPVRAVPPASEASSSTEVHQGEFLSDGRPVQDFYCVPGAPGPHPAVILLHGAVPRGAGNDRFAVMCRDLAKTGYEAMFVEYYSQAGPKLQGQAPVVGRGFAAWVNQNFPVWMREITDAAGMLGNDPAVERDRIAVMGFSLGAFLALAAGAQEGGRLAAVIDNYGGMNRSYLALAANMPPTLILHGGADPTVPVRYAREVDALLTHYNRPHEMVIYPGAGHGFTGADDADAWRRTLDFLRRYLGR